MMSAKWKSFFWSNWPWLLPVTVLFLLVISLASAFSYFYYQSVRSKSHLFFHKSSFLPEESFGNALARKKLEKFLIKQKNLGISSLEIIGVSHNLDFGNNVGYEKKVHTWKRDSGGLMVWHKFHYRTNKMTNGSNNLDITFFFEIISDYHNSSINAAQVVIKGKNQKLLLLNYDRGKWSYTKKLNAGTFKYYKQGKVITSGLNNKLTLKNQAVELKTPHKVDGSSGTKYHTAHLDTEQGKLKDAIPKTKVIKIEL